MSEPQQTRLNKFKAKHIATFFLEIRAQPVQTQAGYNLAQKQDDMADALLQALAYGNLGVNNEGVYQPEIIGTTAKTNNFILIFQPSVEMPSLQLKMYPVMMYRSRQRPSKA